MLDGLAVGLLHRLGTRLWGFPPLLMPALVERLGALRTLAWFVRNMPRYERTRKTLGPLRTHLLATAVSLVNCCEYCAFGHAYAFDLIHLRDRGRPFPLSTDEIVALRGGEPARIREQLAAALADAGLPDEDCHLGRVLSLMSGRTHPVGAQDARLAHLIDMFAVLNDTGIVCGVTPDQAHDPVNKDTRLKAELARLRAHRG
jgi:hypothetical protein